MKKTSPVFVCAAALTVLLSGCVSETVKSTRGELPQKEYAPIVGHNAVLELSGEREFPAGLPCKLTFILQNKGKKEIKISEWHKFEPDNVRVYCQPWLPGNDEPEKDAWIEIELIEQQPSLRHPAVIAPGNSVMIEKGLPFVEKLFVSEGSERRFFIKGELNLQSLKIESPVAAIVVRRPTNSELQNPRDDKADDPWHDIRNAVPARVVK
jgi:hypothetical protein